MMSKSSSRDQPCQSLHGLIASCETLQKIHILKKTNSQIESLLGELVLLNQAGDQ